MAELQDNDHWRMAVWALRFGYVALVVALVGLIATLSGSTPWLLAAGMIGWLVAAVVLAVGFLWARRQLPEPRPGFWSMRFTLIHDTVHTRPVPER
jgi:hypothetical protein